MNKAQQELIDSKIENLKTQLAAETKHRAYILQRLMDLDINVNYYVKLIGELQSGG